MGVTRTPARASRTAGAVSSASGARPNPATAAASPAGVPYVPQEAAPAWKTWVASPKSTVTARNGARSLRSRPRPGVSTKKSSSTASPPGGTTSR